MNQSHEYDMVLNPGEGTTSSLESICEAHPWFGAAQVALARNYYLKNHKQYADQLSRAAIYAGSPAVLYDIIMEPEVAESVEPVVEEIEEDVYQEVEEISAAEETGVAEEVESPEITDPMEREIIVGAVSRSIEQEVAEPAEPEIEETEKDDKPEVATQTHLSPFAAYLLKRSREVGFASDHDSSGAVAEADEGSIIDKFIRNNPQISRGKVDQYSNEDLAKKSLIEDESLITETMAKIYAAQGKLEKARRAYRLLGLKYPEKSIYFAAQLKKLGKKTN